MARRRIATAQPTKEHVLRRIGVNFRAARLAEELTQHDVAALTGRGQSYISAIERGECNITIETLVLLANAVHVNVTALLGTTDAELGEKPFLRRT